MMKFCKHCQAEFDTDGAHWYVQKDPRYPEWRGYKCKVRHDARSKETYNKNPDKVKKAVKKWGSNNPDKVKKYQRDFAVSHKEEIKAKRKNYLSRSAEYCKNYRAKNRQRLNKRKADKARENYHKDVQYRISSNLRSRLWKALNGMAKIGSAVGDLGCDVGYLKKHLESLFTDGMSWGNYGNEQNQWSIDHIKPLAAFDLTIKEQFLSACHFTNLQPMWAPENSKKGARYDF